MDKNIVLIEWLDSCVPTNSWEWLEGAEHSKPVKCFSVGFLLEDEKDYKVIASSIGDPKENQQVIGVMTIPSCSIIRSRNLKTIISKME